MPPIYAGDGTDTGGSTVVNAGTSGGGPNHSSSATAGPSYYSSGGTVIAVQTHGVIHKTITIPKKPPKKGKLY
jgi:hypothetical protein